MTFDHNKITVMRSQTRESSIVPIIASWLCIAWNLFGTVFEAFNEYVSYEYLTSSTKVPSKGTHKFART